MKTIQKLLLALCAMLATVSCTTAGGGPPALRVPGGQFVYNQQHHQQRFAAEDHAVKDGWQLPPIDNGGTWYRSDWKDGDTHRGVNARATVSTLNRALTDSQRMQLSDDISEWAKDRIDKDKVEPTNDQATAEACRRMGHDRVRIIMEYTYSEKHVAHQRQLVSKKEVNASDVRSDARERLQNRARDNFFRHRSNQVVDDERFYPAEDGAQGFEVPEGEGDIPDTPQPTGDSL